MFHRRGAEFYKSDTWRALSAACKRRDGNECQGCRGIFSARGLHAHHRIPRPDVPFCTGLDTLDNLVSLCEECHQKEHPTHRIIPNKGSSKLFRASRPRRPR